LGDGFSNGGSGGCDFLRGGFRPQRKTEGLVSGVTGFHRGDDVGGVGWSAKQAEPLLAQTSGIAVLLLSVPPLVKGVSRGVWQPMRLATSSRTSGWTGGVAF